MADSGGSCSSEPASGSEEPVHGQNNEALAAEPLIIGQPGQEEEKTLTDHLNKKLLESFLTRLDSGNMQLPQGARAADPVELEEDDDFETD